MARHGYELDDHDGARLSVIRGGNGDYFIAVTKDRTCMSVPAVRICTSGGAAVKNPRLMRAVAGLYQALAESEDE